MLSARQLRSGWCVRVMLPWILSRRDMLMGLLALWRDYFLHKHKHRIQALPGLPAQFVRNARKGRLHCELQHGTHLHIGPGLLVGGGEVCDNVQPRFIFQSR